MSAKNLSKNVVCLSHLLHILANINVSINEKQCGSQIRLLLKAVLSGTLLFMIWVYTAYQRDFKTISAVDKTDNILTLYEPEHELLVLIPYANSASSDQPELLCILTRELALPVYFK